MVFILSNPQCSLKTLQDVLFQYGRASGYKINMAKSNIMGFNVSADVKQLIQDHTTISWTSNIRYLGIELKIHMTMTSLKELNLNPLLNAIRQQLRSW